ncbi:hypothetical protein AGABI2DRAFT_146114 [Agaricus bisporus var. bisporus H97]|uniref:hypothetical protein n=1 Tax=Agaricus bisporus var. bisporus (strain H97 / ATCC MYA-4626 / FGSC 10389) TaxID=936046 RepID=UPI00029F57DD|nr:hypothetical protein AGABI2DRAFT_146114 [Agaricus bisporus var. bisporus H97]EKV43220.1 hypothetical protein AGABI2DRAFT_146114 [Agaricus bisporus var. bisporus H97]
MSTPAVLNPDTYLNHWTPENAFQIEVARNLYLAVLGDTANATKYPCGERFRTDSDRFFALCYVFLSAFAKRCCCMLSIWSSSFLFLRRVKAVYPDNNWIKRFFSVLWFINGGTEITVVLGVGASHAPGTLHCIDIQPAHYVIAGGLAPVVFDTLVFLAISYKIGTAYSTMDVRVSWGTLISGRALPRLSRAILQGGQQYYLITVGVYVILVILLGIPRIPPVYQNMFAFPSVSLTASMACRVYRNVKILDLDESTLLPLSDLDFARQEAAAAGKSTVDSTLGYASSSSSTRHRKTDVSTSGGGVGGLVLGRKSQGASDPVSEEWEIRNRA